MRMPGRLFAPDGSNCRVFPAPRCGRCRWSSGEPSRSHSGLCSGGVSYEQEQARRRTLTPFESELRVGTASAEPPALGRPGLWRRFRDWQHRRRLPRTLAGAIALGLVRLAVGFAVGVGLAVLAARLLDRPTPIGFYTVGAAILLSGLLGAQANRQRAAYEYADSGQIVRARPGVTMAAVGTLLLITGGIFEVL
jgi:hypothetical protein